MQELSNYIYIKDIAELHFLPRINSRIALRIKKILCSNYNQVDQVFKIMLI